MSFDQTKWTLRGRLERRPHWARPRAGFASDARGSTAIEYALIVGLVFLAIVAAVRSFTGEMDNMYSEIESALTGR